VRKSALAWIVAALAIGLGLARLGLVIADVGGPHTIAGVKMPESTAVDTLPETLMMALFAGIGALVAARRPRNPVGWLLLTTGVFFGLLLFSERLGWHHLLADRVISDRAADWLWLANWTWIPAVVPLFIFIPLVFPTGRPLSPRWARLLWAASVAVALFVASSALNPGPLENYKAVQNPFGTGHAATILEGVSFALVIVCALASVASLLLRFRRSHGIERQQIKWVWAAGALLVASFVLSGALQTVSPGAADIIQFAGLVGIPIAVAVAILRYRLYDIALVVNRTLVYGSLTAALAIVYLGSVLTLQLVLQGVTSDSSLAVAVSTLGVAALFRPVRARIQELVDRRFYRRKYDAARALESFSARLRDEVDLDSLSAELRALLQDTLQPSHVSLWLRPSGE
jgi:hypothetical protein